MKKIQRNKQFQTIKINNPFIEHKTPTMRQENSGTTNKTNQILTRSKSKLFSQDKLSILRIFQSNLLIPVFDYSIMDLAKSEGEQKAENYNIVSSISEVSNDLTDNGSSVQIDSSSMYFQSPMVTDTTVVPLIENKPIVNKLEFKDSKITKKVKKPRSYASIPGTAVFKMEHNANTAKIDKTSITENTTTTTNATTTSIAENQYTDPTTVIYEDFGGLSQDELLPRKSFFKRKETAHENDNNEVSADVPDKLNISIFEFNELDSQEFNEYQKKKKTTFFKELKPTTKKTTINNKTKRKAKTKLKFERQPKKSIQPKLKDMSTVTSKTIPKKDFDTKITKRKPSIQTELPYRRIIHTRNKLSKLSQEDKELVLSNLLTVDNLRNQGENTVAESPFDNDPVDDYLKAVDPEQTENPNTIIAKEENELIPENRKSESHFNSNVVGNMNLGLDFSIGVTNNQSIETPTKPQRVHTSTPYPKQKTNAPISNDDSGSNDADETVLKNIQNFQTELSTTVGKMNQLIKLDGQSANQISLDNHESVVSKLSNAKVDITSMFSNLATKIHDMSNTYHTIDQLIQTNHEMLRQKLDANFAELHKIHDSKFRNLLDLTDEKISDLITSENLLMNKINK